MKFIIDYRNAYNFDFVHNVVQKLDYTETMDSFQ